MIPARRLWTTEYRSTGDRACSPHGLLPHPWHRDGNRGLAEHFEAGASVAFLLSRPGSGPVSCEDRYWAEAVIGAGGRHGVPMEPFFRAHDTDLVLVDTVR